MQKIFITVNFREGAQVRSVSVGILEDGVQDALGNVFLSEEEKEIYSRFKVGSRRKQFLAGRYIAKETVRRKYPEIEPGEISIIHGVWGFPLLHTDALYQASISIGHADCCAAALFFDSNTHPIGIDVEEMTEKNLSALKHFITEKEQKYIQSAGLHFSEEMHLLWSAKEAAGKALKVGFAIPEDIYTISSITENNDVYSILFENLPMLKVVGWLFGNHVVCIAFPSVWCVTEMKGRTAL